MLTALPCATLVTGVQERVALLRLRGHLAGLDNLHLVRGLVTPWFLGVQGSGFRVWGLGLRVKG